MVMGFEQMLLFIFNFEAILSPHIQLTKIEKYLSATPETISFKIALFSLPFETPFYSIFIIIAY